MVCIFIFLLNGEDFSNFVDLRALAITTVFRIDPPVMNEAIRVKQAAAFE